MLCLFSCFYRWIVCASKATPYQCTGSQPSQPHTSAPALPFFPESSVPPSSPGALIPESRHRLFPPTLSKQKKLSLDQPLLHPAAARFLCSSKVLSGLFLNHLFQFFCNSFWSGFSPSSLPSLFHLCWLLVDLWTKQTTPSSGICSWWSLDSDPGCQWLASSSKVVQKITCLVKTFHHFI